MGLRRSSKALVRSYESAVNAATTKTAFKASNAATTKATFISPSPHKLLLENKENEKNMVDGAEFSAGDSILTATTANSDTASDPMGAF
jgi:hypothetical protein